MIAENKGHQDIATLLKRAKGGGEQATAPTSTAPSGDAKRKADQALPTAVISRKPEKEAK